MRHSYYDPPEQYYSRELGKRREYTCRRENTKPCDICRRSISVGEKYRVYAADTEDGFQWCKVHTKCDGYYGKDV